MSSCIQVKFAFIHPVSLFLPSKTWAHKDVRGTWKSLKLPRQHKLFFSSMSHPEPSKSRESHHAVNFSVIFLIQSQNTPCIMSSCWTPGRFPREKFAYYSLLVRPAVISLCAFSPRAGGLGKRRATDTTHSSGSQEGDGRLRSAIFMPALNSQQLEVSPTRCSKYPSLPFQDPCGYSSSGAQCNARNWLLPLLNHSSGTNKTCRESPPFAKPTHPQNCCFPPLGNRWHSLCAGKREVLIQLAAMTQPQQNCLRHPPVSWSSWILGMMSTASSCAGFLLLYLSFHFCFKFIKMCKCGSAGREPGGVKPCVYPKRFSWFKSYFLLYLALYWMPPLALFI